MMSDENIAKMKIMSVFVIMFMSRDGNVPHASVRML